MNRLAIALFALFSIFCTQPGHSKECEEQCPKTLEGYTVVNITEINEEMLYALMGGDSGRVIIEVPKGTAIPFKFSLQGNLINLEPVDRDPVFITFLQTVYVKINGDEVRCSQDLQNWFPISDFLSGDVNLMVEPSEAGLTIQLDTFLLTKQKFPILK